MKKTIQNDLTQKYSKATIATHWLTALLILILFPLGKYMENIETSEKMGLITIHVILGIIVFVLTIVRTRSFFKHERPSNLETGSKFNNKLTVWIHNVFYIILFILSISGLAVMVLGGYAEALQSNTPEFIKNRSEIAPMKVHGITSFIMMVLLVLHILGVLKHYIFTKENTLKRIS
ncbi:MAG: cytochrome b/b6 domain-containing protein [Flavobacteriaceae bacterium]|jgi:cytochrome b561|nr:cytochrome b/b6 domain-containing protein [Flavobacteriaceae bacterium]